MGKLLEAIAIEKRYKHFLDKHPLNILSMTTEQLNTELEKGYTDMLEGRTENAKVVFDDIRMEVHY